MYFTEKKSLCTKQFLSMYSMYRKSKAYWTKSKHNSFTHNIITIIREKNAGKKCSANSMSNDEEENNISVLAMYAFEVRVSARPGVALQRAAAH